MSIKLQNEDFASEAELITRSATKANLLNTNKIYAEKTGIADTLSTILRKNNDSAILDPTVSNDDSEGYEVGSRWVNTGTGKILTCVDASTGAAVWVEGGGGGLGNADTVLIYDMDDYADTTTGWDLGDNVDNTPGTGGSFVGTLAKEIASPLHGAASLKYTQAAGSLNSFFWYPVKDIEDLYQGQDCSFNTPLKYDGNTGDIELYWYDVTNSKFLNTSGLAVESSAQIKNHAQILTLPSNIAQIRLGFHVKVENIGAILETDLTNVSSKPFVYDGMIEVGSISFKGHSSGNAPIVFDADEQIDGNGVISNTTRSRITIEKKCSVSIYFQADYGANLNLGNTSQIDLNIYNSAGGYLHSRTGFDHSNTFRTVTKISALYNLNAGDYIEFHTDGQVPGSSYALTFCSVQATHQVESVVTPATAVSQLAHFGGFIARRSGLHADVIEYASRVYNLDSNGDDVSELFSDTTDTSDGTVITADKECFMSVILGVRANATSAIASLYKYNSAGSLQEQFRIDSALLSHTGGGGTEFKMNVGDYIVVNANQDLSNQVSETYLSVKATPIKPTFNVVAPIRRRMFIDVDDLAVNYTTNLASTTAYKTQTLFGVGAVGDNFGVVDSNQLKLFKGTYDFIVPIGSYNNSNFVEFRLRNITDASNAFEAIKPTFNSVSGGAQTMINIVFRIVLTDTKIFEFQTKASNTAGNEFLGRPIIDKIK